MIAERLLELAESLRQESSKQDLLDCVNTCFSYLNIQMESSILITMGDKSIAQIEALNNKRNHAHDKMCEAMHSINQLAKEKRMDKIFDFELEPMQKNGRMAGYSQDNHYKTAGFCAIMADEMLYLGRETCRTAKEIEKLKQEITEKVERRLVEKLSLDSMIEKLNEFEKKHFSLDTVMSLEENKAYEISFRDKTGSFIIIPLDDYSVEIQDIDLSNDSAMKDFMDISRTGEVPKSVLKEEILAHDGYNIISVYEIEKEQKIERDTTMYDLLNDDVKEKIRENQENVKEYSQRDDRKNYKDFNDISDL